MPILDAALAFSLTMLVVASTVTLIVRVLKNTAAMRADTMKTMLEEYLDKELKPVIEHEAKRISASPTLKQAAQDMTYAVEVFLGNASPPAGTTVKPVDNFVTSTLPKQEEMWPEKGSRMISTFFKRLIVKKDKKAKYDYNKVPSKTHLSTEDLLEALKQNYLGGQLLKTLGDEADKVFDTLGKRYEAVGARFTESFRKKSRLWTTILALILALALNIDSLFILDSYIKDETLREDVIAQMDVIIDRYETTIATIPDDDNVTKEAFQQSVDSTKTQIALLKSSGFPIGLEYFPHGCWGDIDTADCTRRWSFGGWFWWILGILLTAGLAGLGAPFWYDAVRGISSLTQQAGKGQKAAPK